MVLANMLCSFLFFFFKQKTAYEMRISDWSSDVCSSDLVNVQQATPANVGYRGYPKATCISVNNVVCHGIPNEAKVLKDGDILNIDVTVIKDGWHGDTSRMYYAGEPSVMARRSEEHTSELQSLMRISYAVFCLKKKKTTPPNKNQHQLTQNLAQLLHT